MAELWPALVSTGQCIWALWGLIVTCVGSVVIVRRLWKRAWRERERSE